jgi:hypothetical protein
MIDTPIAHQHAHRHRASGANQHDRDRRQAAGHQQIDHGERHHRADHHHFAVREIDELDDAVDHRVAERHDGIDASCGQAIDQLLQERVHVARA